MTQGAANLTPDGLTEEQVRLKLQGLQHEVARSATMVRRLAVLAIVLVVVLVVLLISLHLYHVMQYASVASVEARAAGGGLGAATIVYAPESAGKIDFIRESDGLVQTVTEYVNGPGPTGTSREKFTWSGKAGERSTIRATYREGLFLVTKDLSLTDHDARP